ncbi:unnamed protein product [Rotaria magnacalcarata]
MITNTVTNPTAEAVVQQNNQILRITLALTIISFITFSIILTSSYWVVLTYPPDFFFKRHNLYVVRATYGLIWECVVGRSTLNAVYVIVRLKHIANNNKCDYHQNQVFNESSSAEQTLIGMVRTMLSFSAIHILLLVITFICGLYSIREYRYTYKRLTGMIYILTAASLVVCMEALSIIFRHVSVHLPYIYPPGTTHSYGVCFVLSWFIVIQLVASAFVFFICSKKRKGTFDEATEEEAMANLTVDLGRI